MVLTLFAARSVVVACSSRRVVVVVVVVVRGRGGGGRLSLGAVSAHHTLAHRHRLVKPRVVDLHTCQPPHSTAVSTIFRNFSHRRNCPVGPAGRVPSNFGERGTSCIWSPPTFATGCHFAGQYGEPRALPETS